MRINIKDLKFPGYRWPDFSDEYKALWRKTMEDFLQGNKNFFPSMVFSTDNFRMDVHFWKEMQLWAAMTHAYPGLGGDAVPDLAKTMLIQVTEPPTERKIYEAILESQNVEAVLDIVTKAVMDMDVQIGGDSFEMAKDHMHALGVKDGE